MSGTYTRYTVEDAEGVEQPGVWEQSKYTKARGLAQRINGMVIAQEYTWEDSELIDDFRSQPDGE